MNAPVMPTPIAQSREYLEMGREFIEQEAVLLEERRWDEWLALFTSDCEYWVPAWRHDGGLTTDPSTELSLIYYAGREGLEDRVLRLRSPHSPASRLASRTTHLVGNIRLGSDCNDTSLHLKSSWVTHVFWPRTNSADVFFGAAEYHLMARDGAWRIARKKIVLNNDYVSTMIDLYCL